MQAFLPAFFLITSGALAAAPPPKAMVVAANPLAAQAGAQILREGGTAVDAAVAVQAVLGLVEPQASGVGGGAFMVTYDAASKRLTTYDGRETAPAAAGGDLFLNQDGSPKTFYEAAMGGRSVGVPGAIAMLEMAQHAEGKLKWESLFDPAIHLAETGFPITERVSKIIGFEAERIGRSPALAAYLMPHGVPAEETVLKNAAYAATLRLIAHAGAAGLLRGKIAADIVAAVRGDANPGLMTMDDLASYHAIQRDPVCAPFASYSVCSVPPPSAGGLAVLETLGELDHTKLASLQPGSVDAAVLLLDAERLAMADRDAFVGDPEFVTVPTAALVAPSYLAERAKALDPAHALADARPGSPVVQNVAPVSQKAQPEHGTSDVAIVDAAGNAVSMTTTVEYEFGSHLFVDGFVLNNELTDFSFEPNENGKPVANRVQGGKRPRSSMAPVIVQDQAGGLVAVAGSAGGKRIPGFVIQPLLDTLVWHMTPAQAMAQGHVDSTGSRNELEQDTPAALLYDALRARGEAMTVGPIVAGTAMILMTKAGPEGAADPRRDGAAVGK
jgi:gamma-glutamyltranspeptidase/glutathione hydrolase